MSADYDLLLQEIARDNKKAGVDQSGYIFTQSDEESPIRFEESNKEDE